MRLGPILMKKSLNLLTISVVSFILLPLDIIDLTPWWLCFVLHNMSLMVLHVLFIFDRLYSKFPPVINKFGFPYGYLQRLIKCVKLVFFRRWYLACDRLIQLSSLHNVYLCLIDFIIPCVINLFPSCLYLLNLTYLYDKYLFFICVKWSCKIS